MTISQTPTLPEVLREALRADRLTLHTSITGICDSWDPDTGLADINVGVQTFAPTESDGMKARALPMLLSVPVAIPGGGKFRMGFPLKKGDPMEIVFNEASIDAWLEKGGYNVDPEDRRRHHLADAIAFAGSRPKPQRWKSLSDKDASWGLDDGPQFVAKDNGELWLGGKEGSADLTENGVLGKTQKDDLGSMLDSASQACTSASSACTSAATIATTVGTAATTAGGACSAITLLSPAGTGFTALGVGMVGLATQLGSLSAQLSAMGQAFSQLKAKLANHLSSTVKLK